MATYASQIQMNGVEYLRANSIPKAKLKDNGAVVEQVVPSGPREVACFTKEAIRLMKQSIRHRILAIDAELNKIKSASENE